MAANHTCRRVLIVGIGLTIDLEKKLNNTATYQAKMWRLVEDICRTSRQCDEAGAMINNVRQKKSLSLNDCMSLMNQSSISASDKAMNTGVVAQSYACQKRLKSEYHICFINTSKHLMRVRCHTLVAGLDLKRLACRIIHAYNVMRYTSSFD